MLKSAAQFSVSPAGAQPSLPAAILNVRTLKMFCP